jgi:exonuclease SbcD
MDKPLPGQLTLGKDVMGYEKYRPTPRLLAFADAHLGNYRYPIREHIISAMRQIERRVSAIRPDFVLFAGDAFRHRVPSAQDVGEFGHFLASMARYSKVICIPGNHDIAGQGATTLDVYDEIDNVWVDKVPAPIDFHDWQLITFPWLPKKSMDSMGLEASDNATAIRMLLDLLKQNLDPNKFSVLLAHATALGTEYRDGASTVLGDDVLWTSDMFEGFDLCLLGHIHKRQEVHENVFYIGSVCPVSFNEANQTKYWFEYDNAVNWEPIAGPEFFQLGMELGEPFPKETFDNGFLQIKKPHDAPDPEPPECLWYEIVSLPPEREMRQRLGDDALSLSPAEALESWLVMENIDPDPVLGLAKELMEEE